MPKPRHLGPMKLTGTAQVRRSDGALGEPVRLNAETYFPLRIAVENDEIIYRPINNQETI